jgi:hypothetical protein
MRAILWVPATSQEIFERAYHDIANLLELPGCEDSQVDIKALVKSQLSNERFGPWLLLVDSADDADILFGDQQEGSTMNPLINYLPQSRKGSVVFTTRTRAMAIRLAENNVIPLGELEKAEAVEILQRRLSQEDHYQLEEVDTVNELLRMLSFHALAIVRAIAFMNKNSVTLFDYINLYRDSEKDAIDLLSEEFEDRTRYQEATNSVATTWYISFGRLQKQDPIAAEHLFFVACIANSDIAASVFPPKYTKTEFVKAMGTLKAYAFITERQRQAFTHQQSMQRRSTTIDVHPLVHLAIRSWLKAHHQWISHVEITLARLIKITPYGNQNTREYWMTYLHHAVHIVNIPESHEMRGIMTLLERIGGCERELGRYQAAERTYRQAFEQRLKMSGEEHPATLMTKGNIGLVMGFTRKLGRSRRNKPRSVCHDEEDLRQEGSPHACKWRQSRTSDVGSAKV